MQPIRLLATDLDGTLLDSRGEISQENLRAIHELAARGIPVVPASGRSFSEMPEILRTNPDIRYYIYSCGAAVLDRMTGERIEMCIPHETVVHLLDTLYRYETHISYRRGGCCIGDGEKRSDDDYAYYNVWNRHREVIEAFASFDCDFKAHAYESDRVEMMAVYFHDEEECEACKRALSRIDGISFVHVVYCGIEIFSAAAGKDRALMALADRLGIPHAQTAAVGDSDNDLTMVRAAGVGIAVSNACRSLLEAADTVICSNDEHAIADIAAHLGPGL